MSMVWHYVQNGKALGPVPEEQLKILLSTGTLQAEDLVWREGMSGWKAAREFPELVPAAPQPAAPQPIAPQQAAPRPAAANPYTAPQTSLNAPAAVAAGPVSAEAVELLRRTKPWVRFFSVLGIFGIVFMGLGALAMVALSFGPFQTMPLAARIGMAVLYLVLAFLYIPPVLYLHRYASRIRELVDENSSVNLENALRAQKSFWKYIGMFTVITLIVYILVLAGIMLTGVVMGLGNRL